MPHSQPIGIFDSGVGGLSIGLAVQSLLPLEQLIYVADLAYSPYGSKEESVITARSLYVANFLVSQGCKAIVVACNTATVNAIAHLRASLSVPIIGVEPAVKPAVLNSKRGIVGILATARTLESRSFQRLKQTYATAEIHSQACPRFVTLVENLAHQHTTQAIPIINEYIQPLLDMGCDQLVLGCTHFSFLKPLITQVVGDRAEVIDTAIPVAAELKRRLSSPHQLNSQYMDENNAHSKVTFWTSGDPNKLEKSINTLWINSSPASVKALP